MAARLQGGVGAQAATLGADAVPVAQAELEWIAARITCIAAEYPEEAEVLLAAAVAVHEAARRIARMRLERGARYD